MSIVECKECKKEVSSTVSVCPHCGATLKTSCLKVGCLVFILGLMAISGVTCIGCLETFSEVAKENRAKEIAKMESLRNSPVNEQITPLTVSQVFELGTRFTEIQREKYLKEIIGQKIRWTGRVYEAKKTTEGYRIQLKGSGNQIGAFITIVGYDDGAYIEALQDGSYIRAIGIVDGTTLRNIDLDPAVLEH